MAKVKKKKLGRPVKNWTAKYLKDSAEYYFGKCDSRTKKVIDKDGFVVDVPAPLPYTVEGLCCHLNISTTTFRNWKAQDDALG